MEQSNPRDISAAPASILSKRKRGRPRKDRGLIRASKIQSHSIESSEVANDSIVGLTVTGVVEAAFDAGYMLKVRIGDSDISLRGVVFKPGHYIPISTENDIAPHVQMIQRNEIPLQKVRKVRRSKGSRRKQDREDYNNNMSSFLNEGFEQSNQDNEHAPGKYSVAPGGSRGSIVPVLLKPVMPNVVTPSLKIPIVASPLKVSSNSNNRPGQSTQEETEDMNDEPLFVEPLQTIHSVFNSQIAPISRPPENREMGRMSELLEVLQEKLTE